MTDLELCQIVHAATAGGLYPRGYHSGETMDVARAVRDACAKFVETAAADYLSRADRLSETGANLETVRLHEQAGAALEACALNLKAPNP